MRLMGESIFSIVATPAPLPSDCTRCSLSNLCLPLAVSKGEIKRLENVVQQNKTVNKGDHIFEQHQPFCSCFVVRSGAIKTYMASEDGKEQITGFYLPGELIGLDSINVAAYSCSARALDRTSVCEIPFDKLEELASKIPSLQHHIFQLMSKEIEDRKLLTTLLRENSAEGRIASLFLSLSSRFRRRRLSLTHFRLPMSRNDIANYLGLAGETVSRAMTRFQAQKLINVQGREITLMDLDGLQELVKHSRCQSRAARSLGSGDCRGYQEGTLVSWV